MKNISYDLIEKFRAGAGSSDAERQILAGETDSAYLYALSPDRGNLFSWYPWERGMHVLQLGADYGVFCPGVADRAGALDIVDERDEMLALIRFRFPKRLKEAGGNVGLLRHVPRETYDAVLLPSVPAAAVAKQKGDLPQFLRTCAASLKPGGSLLFAIDNAAALKYAAGAKKDASLFYEDEAALGEIAEKLPFSKVRRYYPLPDLCFAKNIYSDAYLPDAGAFRGIAESYLEPRYALCDEEAIYGMLTKTGAFPAFAPSFLYVLEGYAPDKTQGAHTAVARSAAAEAGPLGSASAHTERTTQHSAAVPDTKEEKPADTKRICAEEKAQNTAEAVLPAQGQTDAADASVRKEAQKEKPAPAADTAQEAEREAAADTAQAAEKHADAAKKTPAAEAVRPSSALPVYIRFNRSRLPIYCIKTEIIPEKDGEQVRKTALSKEANAHIASFEEKYKLLRHDLERRGEEEKTGRKLPKLLPPKMGRDETGCLFAQFEFLHGKTMAELIGEEIADGRAPVGKIKDALEFLMGTGIHPCHNLDLVFENVMSCGGEFYLLDYEWVFEYELNRDFVRYRILRYWYEAYKEALYAYPKLEAFLEEFGIKGEVLADCEARERSFQEYVHGAEEDGAARFLQPQKTLAEIQADEEKLKEFTDWNLRLQDEVEEHKTALKKEREVERLSQNHIRNIEKINRTQQEALDAVQAELEYLRRHQSLPSRAVRRMVAKLDAAAPAGSKKRKLIHYAKNTLRHPVKCAKLYLTAEGRNDIAGDFAIGGEYAEGGKLRLPQCRHLAAAGGAGAGTAAEPGKKEADSALRAPLVSIILPVYNQVAYTYACVRSILAHTSFEETPYEIILADDVSTDATAEIGRYIEGLVISRNTENQGFLKNCNQAAKRAAGKYLFFLNNDTKVTDGWLSSLVELIERDPSIGMVGSKLVYPDGRLQEAGGIIWSDASGWNYGRLDDPSKPEYNYVKDVDYISGAAIMLSKELWNEIGGFDERFAPAYCEDSDLAFEVRRRKKRVVLQPKSVIIHFEGISNGTDVTGTGLKRYQVVNQEKFKEKWQAALKKQSVNDGNPNPFAARDRSQGKPCVLIVDHYVPTWDKDAGSRTTYQYIRMFLAKGWNVKFLGDNFLHEEPYSSELEQLGVEILYGEAHQNDIFDWIKKNQDFIDVAYLNRPHIAVKYIDFIREQTKIKRIYYGHDLHFMRLGREYELNGDIRTKREADYWKSVEFSVMEQADMIYYPSETEIEAIHAVNPALPAKAITAYVWDRFEEANPETGLVGEDYVKREGLLFVGGFAHPPNADGVLWFAQKIFPLIREALPDVKFYIAGSHETDEIKALGEEPDNGIEVLGFVSDEKLHELYHTSKLVVVPLRYGAGVKGKVVEALYNGAVIVTTSVGAEGIPEAKSVMAVTDDCAEDIYAKAELIEQRFAEAVVRLYQDDAFCRAANRADQRYIRQYYSMDAAWRVVADDFSPRIPAHKKPKMKLSRKFLEGTEL